MEENRKKAEEAAKKAAEEAAKKAAEEAAKKEAEEAAKKEAEEAAKKVAEEIAKMKAAGKQSCELKKTAAGWLWVTSDGKKFDSRLKAENYIKSIE